MRISTKVLVVAGAAAEESGPFVGFFFELIIFLNFRAALETAFSTRHMGVPAYCLVIFRLVLALSFSAVA